jgi:hypothetical protein
MKKFFLFIFGLVIIQVSTGQNNKSITIHGPTDVCPDSSYQYYVDPEAGVTRYYWTASGSMSVTFTADTSDWRKVHAYIDISSNSGAIYVCKNSQHDPPDGSLDVTVNKAITNTPVITGEQNICLGLNSDSVTYTASSTPNVQTYVWIIPLTASIIWASSDSSTISVKFSSVAPVAQIRVFGKNPCSSGFPNNVGNLDISINPTLAPTINILSFRESICIGTSDTLKVRFINGGLNGKIKLFLNGVLKDSAQTGSNSEDMQFIFPNLTETSNIFKIQLFSTVACRNPGVPYPVESGDTIFVSPPSYAGKLFSKHDTICESYPDTIWIDQSAVGNVLSWQRKLKTASDWIQVPFIHPEYYVENTAPPGVWQYRAAIKSGACPEDISDILTIVINNGPGQQELVPKNNPQHKNHLLLMCISCSYPPQNSIYSWGKILLNPPGPALCPQCDSCRNKNFCLFDDNDTRYKYYLAISSGDKSGCADTTFFTPSKSESENPSKSSFILYPNPNSGRITLELTSPYTGQVDIIVRDLAGKEVRTFRIQKLIPVQAVPFDISMLMKGTYLIETVFGDGERLINKTMLY